MYAIETYYIGPTSYRGARIAARVMEKGNGFGGKVRRKVLNRDHAWPPSVNHHNAAASLAKDLGWSGQWYEGGGDQGASIWVNASCEPDKFTVIL